MYQYEENLYFHPLSREIKRKREEKGWTQKYLAQLVDRIPRSIMYKIYAFNISASPAASNPARAG